METTQLKCPLSHEMAPGVVLDTNAVLDLLAFSDPRSPALRSALTLGRIRWLASAHMRDELDHVVRRSAAIKTFAKWRIDPARVLEQWDEAVVRLDGPVVSHPLLRCRDPDDQPFLDFALAHGARWLVTHDRDLRTLGARAKRLGLLIVPPQDWRDEPALMP